jgi:hypothetical protein
MPQIALHLYLLFDQGIGGFFSVRPENGEFLSLVIFSEKFRIWRAVEHQDDFCLFYRLEYQQLGNQSVLAPGITKF